MFRLLLAVVAVSCVVAGGLSPSRADIAAGLEAYNAGDFETAVAEWFPLAESGDPDAQYRIGLLHFDGEGVPEDKSAALEWWTRAAYQGELGAQNALGYMYDLGVGVEPDRDRAKCWYVLAAEQGDSQAQFNLGSFLQRGEGPHGNHYWRLRAARQGHVRAMAVVGWVMWKNPLERDKVSAYMYLILAAERGDEEARMDLETLRETDRSSVQRNLAVAEERAAAWEPELELQPTTTSAIPNECQS